MTGFILNDNLLGAKKDYKPQEKISCLVLDIDYEKEIIDLIQASPEISQSNIMDILLVKDRYLVGRYQNSFAVYILSTNEDSSSFQIGHRLQNVTSFQLKSQLKKYQNVVFLKTQESKKSQLQLGLKVTGKVLKKSKNFVYVQLQNGCHKAQFDLQNGVSAYEQFEKDHEITCKILSHGKPNFELTCLKEHMNLPDMQLDSSKFILDGQKNEQTYQGVIKSIQPQSIQPIYVELSGNMMGSLNAFGHIFDAKDAHRLNNLQSEFKEGDVINVKIVGQQANSPNGFQNFDLALASTSQNYQPKEGGLAICKIVSVQNYRVQYDKKAFSTISMTEISEELVNQPLSSLQLQKYYVGRILPSGGVSLRSSVIDSYDQINSTTLAFKKHFAQQEKQFDFRNRIIKFGAAGLSPQQLILGWVTNVSPVGVFLSLGDGVTARASPNQIEGTFRVSQTVLCRVLSIENGKVDVSLKKHLIVYKYEQIKENQERGCIVKERRGEGWMVSIKGCNVKAEMKSANVKEGDHGKVEVNKVTSEGRVRVTWKAAGEFGKLETEEVHQIWESLQLQQKEQEESQEDEMEEESMEEEQNESEEIDDSDQLDLQELEKEAMELEDESEELDEGDDMEEEDIDEEQSQESDENNNSDEIASSEEPEDQKNLTMKQRQSRKLQKELEIRKQEQKLLDEDRQPENNDDFEKLILQQPNNSYVWIQYVAFVMEQEGVKDARQVIERAIRVINFRNEQDKVNLWTAYLNLEYNFGTEQSLISVFEKSLQTNKPKTMYFKLIEIYSKDQKHDILNQILEKMIKKFKRSSKAWIEYIKQKLSIQKQVKFQSQTKSDLDFKLILNRALQAVKKKKHIEILSTYARLEFLNGNYEKGRTTFEAIVNNYPKRTDIWSVYLDCEIKHKQIQQARNLFERCITLKLKTKKIQFFFKKYHEFEMNQGDEKRVEKVKEKAQAYVQSMIGDQQIEEEDSQEESE